MVTRVIDYVPRYATLDRRLFREHLEALYDAFVELCRSDDGSNVQTMLAALTRVFGLRIGTRVFNQSPKLANALCAVWVTRA